MANITITDLSELTTTPAGTAVVPVVDGGSTQKITVANLKAYMQTGTFAATTVTSSAQPNITSVGTLASLSVTGNLNISSNVTFSNANCGTITGSYLTMSYVTVTSELNVATVTSNFIPQTNVTYSLGNSTNRWKDIYLASSTVYLGNVQLSEGAGNSLSVAGNITVNNITTTSGTSTLNAMSVTGNVQAGNVRTSGLMSATGKIISGDDISVTGLISASGNLLSGGTIYTSGMVMSNGFTSTSAANVYDVDTSGTVASYASSATVVFQNFSGMIIVNSHTTGGVALWLVGGNAVQQIGSATGSDTGTITYSAGTYIWTNNTGITADIAFAAIRTRQAA
jgi:hypothetical protein